MALGMQLTLNGATMHDTRDPFPQPDVKVKGGGPD